MNKFYLYAKDVSCWYVVPNINSTSYTLEDDFIYATPFESKEQAMSWLIGATCCDEEFVSVFQLV